MSYNWYPVGNPIEGINGGDSTGSSISLSDDGRILAIGSPYFDQSGTDRGAVRVYERINSSWIQIGSDIYGENAGDRHGHSIKLNSDGLVLVVGAPFNDGGVINGGSLRVYDWNGTDWIQRGLDINGLVSGDEFGKDVDISSDGNTIAVMTTTGIKVFTWQSGWVSLGTIAGESALSSVSLSSDGFTVAYSASQTTPGSTIVRAFAWNGTNWATKGSVGFAFIIKQVELSNDGNTLFFGYEYNAGGGNMVADCFKYQWTGTSWTQSSYLRLQSSSQLNPRISLNGSGSLVALSATNGTFVYDTTSTLAVLRGSIMIAGTHVSLSDN
jgi:hypothetical protein